MKIVSVNIEKNAILKGTFVVILVKVVYTCRQTFINKKLCRKMFVLK